MVFDSHFRKSVLNSSFVLKNFFYWSFSSKKNCGSGFSVHSERCNPSDVWSGKKQRRIRLSIFLSRVSACAFFLSFISVVFFFCLFFIVSFSQKLIVSNSCYH